MSDIQDFDDIAYAERLAALTDAVMGQALWHNNRTTPAGQAAAHAILAHLRDEGWYIDRNARERDELARQQTALVARLRARLVSADAAVDAAAEWRQRQREAGL